ncbi:MAG: thiamine pyrophosphate-dependent enzyme, partial [Chloroflexota bacterium]|nr:thiamine pyrophosphate-dependent enzyme [Chloroflexota bacterium]
FLSTYGIHGLHGRSLPLATGVKLARPDLHVLVFGGDGDLFSIGAGHTPHAARRNVDITVVNMDNQIYGLTKAQFSPTSKLGQVSKSSPYGSLERPMNPVLLALSMGATFVARGYSGKPKQLQEMIVKGIQHKGFSFIHIHSPCTEFHNTFNLYDALVQDIPTEHDTGNLEAALHLVLSEERVNIGVFYQVARPTLDEGLRRLEKQHATFDLKEHMARFQ